MWQYSLKVLMFNTPNKRRKTPMFKPIKASNNPSRHNAQPHVGLNKLHKLLLLNPIKTLNKLLKFLKLKAMKAS